METDRFSGAHGCSEPRALAAYEAAVECVAAHRPAAAQAIDAALAIDPDFVAAHALKGFFCILLARSETLAKARGPLSDARRALGARRPTPSEAALLAALARAVDGELLAAAGCLDQHLAQSPRDFVALKLAHGLRFMAGDEPGMLRATARALPHYGVATPAYGFVLGCHAFGLEEAGDFARAERFGLAALRHEPRDAWGLHAVSHVLEMQGRAEEGVGWLARTRPLWKECNNFAFHMGWHLALFHLSLGDGQAALDLYDADIRPAPTDDFRDVANAVSLLWRLGQEGVDVGCRWEELHTLAKRRRDDTTLVFASLHDLLALVAVGDRAGARDLADAIGARAAASAGDQAGVAARVGVELAETIVSLGERGGAMVRNPFDAARLMAALPAIGGSHAQRDVFVRTLALVAADDGDAAALETVLSARRLLKREDSIVSIARERLERSGPGARTRIVA